MSDFSEQIKEADKIGCNFKLLDGSHSPINCCLKNPPKDILYGYACDGKNCIFQKILIEPKEDIKRKVIGILEVCPKEVDRLKLIRKIKEL